MAETCILLHTVRPLAHVCVTFDPLCGSAEDAVVHVVAEEYLHRMADHACFKINVLGTVLETGQVFCEQDDFRLGKPELEIDVSGERCSS